MRRLIITGPNGAGKSLFANRLAQNCPDVEPVSYDALRLATDWKKRPDVDCDAALADVIARKHWVIEGGPSLLRASLPRADGLVWLDPPRHVLAARLARRPWMNRGRVRPELPDGNVDWIGQQYRFAWASLRRFAQFRAGIEAALAHTTPPCVWRCRTQAKVGAALREIGLSLVGDP